LEEKFVEDNMIDKEIAEAKEKLESLYQKKALYTYNEVVEWCENFKMEFDKANYCFHRNQG